MTLEGESHELLGKKMTQAFLGKILPCWQASLLALCTSPSSLQYPHEVPPARQTHGEPLWNQDLT